MCCSASSDTIVFIHWNRSQVCSGGHCAQYWQMLFKYTVEAGTQLQSALSRYAVSETLTGAAAVSAYKIETKA